MNYEYKEYNLSQYSVIKVQHNRTGRDYFFFVRKGSTLLVRTAGFDRGHINTGELHKQSDFVFGREGYEFSYSLTYCTIDHDVAKRLFSMYCTENEDARVSTV